MQINPPVVFTFTRQRWSSTVPPSVAFDVWASNTNILHLAAPTLFSLRLEKITFSMKQY